MICRWKFFARQGQRVEGKQKVQQNSFMREAGARREWKKEKDEMLGNLTLFFFQHIFFSETASPPEVTYYVMQDCAKKWRKIVVALRALSVFEMTARLVMRAIFAHRNVTPKWHPDIVCRLIENVESLDSWTHNLLSVAISEMIRDLSRGNNLSWTTQPSRRTQQSYYHERKICPQLLM